MMASEKKRIGYAVLGLGIGMAHAEAAHASEYAALVAVCDTDEKRLAKAKALYPDVTCYTDAEALFLDPSVDIISDCSFVTLILPLSTVSDKKKSPTTMRSSSAADSSSLIP